MIKTIAIDMDGTLLNKMQKVSEENKHAIQKAQSEGVEVIIATGRSYVEARFALDEAGIVCPVICVNGLCPLHGGRKNCRFQSNVTPLLKWSLDSSKNKGYISKYIRVKEFIPKTMKTQYLFWLMYSLQRILTLIPRVCGNLRERCLQLGQVTSISDYSELFSRSNEEYYKILSFSKDLTLLNQIASKLKGQGVTVTSSGRENVEIMSETAQKVRHLKHM